MSKRKSPPKARKKKIAEVLAAAPPVRLVPRIIPEPEPEEPLFEPVLVVTAPIAHEMPRTYGTGTPAPGRSNTFYAAVIAVVVVLLAVTVILLPSPRPGTPVMATAPIAPAVVEAPTAVEPDLAPEAPPVAEAPAVEPEPTPPSNAGAKRDMTPAHRRHHGKSELDAARLNREELRDMRRYEREHNGSLE